MTKITGGSYGIGAVVRQTGLPAPTIRIWEKRYGAVSPIRTETNRRLYSAEDVARLGLLRSLTELGHSIGNIANLSLSELEQQFSEDRNQRSPAQSRGSQLNQGRVLVAGHGAAEAFLGEPSLELDLVGQFKDLSLLREQEALPVTDLLFIQAETLHPETVTTVRECVARTGAERTILLYQFSSSKTATALAKAIPGLTLLTGPVNTALIRREVLTQLGSLYFEEVGADSYPEEIPERLYSNDHLMKFAKVSTSVDCECPQHLAGLLQSLSAFEKYSRECEDRNPQDALLHTFLHRCTANVRRTMEEALQHLARVEGIMLE